MRHGHPLAWSMQNRRPVFVDALFNTGRRSAKPGGSQQKRAGDRSTCCDLVVGIRGRGGSAAKVTIQAARTVSWDDNGDWPGQSVTLAGRLPAVVPKVRRKRAGVPAREQLENDQNQQAALVPTAVTVARSTEKPSTSSPVFSGPAGLRSAARQVEARSAWHRTRGGNLGHRRSASIFSRRHRAQVAARRPGVSGRRRGGAVVVPGRGGQRQRRGVTCRLRGPAARGDRQKRAVQRDFCRRCRRQQVPQTRHQPARGCTACAQAECRHRPQSPNVRVNPAATARNASAGSRWPGGAAESSGGGPVVDTPWHQAAPARQTRIPSPWK